MKMFVFDTAHGWRMIRAEPTRRDAPAAKRHDLLA